MKIILTGSLGHISLPLAKTLIQKGHSVTIISSNPEKQQAIEALGATAAIGQLQDAGFLTKTFSNADAVYCMVPPNYAATDQVAYYRSVAGSYATAIQQSGVKRVVHLSSYGAHLESGTGFIVGSHNSEKIMNAIPGISLTHMRPVFFYYNLLSFIDMIKAAGFMGSVYGGEDKLLMVAPSDIAAAVAEELETTVSNQKVRYVASDERTCNEIAAILGNAIGKPDLQWLTLPPEKVRETLLGNGLPEYMVDNLVEMGLATHNGILHGDFDLNKPAFGNVTIEEYAQEFAKVYLNK